MNRRASYHDMRNRMEVQFREWRTSMPCYRMEVFNTGTKSPPMGEMDDAQIAYWARRVSMSDAEASIRRLSDSSARSKTRAGQAQ